jgi:hypothetical protein
MGGLPGIFLSPGIKKRFALCRRRFGKKRRLAAAFLCAACERSMGEERRDEVSLLAEGSAYLKFASFGGKSTAFERFRPKARVCMKVCI